MPRPICFRLLTHCIRRAASRAACTAGNKSAIRTAMIAITTSNSMSVKPRSTQEYRTCGERFVTMDGTLVEPRKDEDRGAVGKKAWNHPTMLSDSGGEVDAGLSVEPRAPLVSWPGLETFSRLRI